MVRIRHMRMDMRHRRVPMGVAVAIGRRRKRAVVVVVVTVVVTMRMLVFQWLVRVFMPVRFHQVQRDASQHQTPASGHSPAQGLIAECHRQHRTDKRCEGEHRPGSSRPNERWASR